MEEVEKMPAPSDLASLLSLVEEALRIASVINEIAENHGLPKKATKRARCLIGSLRWERRRIKHALGSSFSTESKRTDQGTPRTAVEAWITLRALNDGDLPDLPYEFIGQLRQALERLQRLGFEVLALTDPEVLEERRFRAELTRSAEW